METNISSLQRLKRREKPVIRIRGAVNNFTGYGLHTQYTAKHLSALGYQVEVVPTSDVQAPFPEVIPALKINPSDHRRELVILPSEHRAKAHQWLFTMYETTRLPNRLFKNVQNAHAVIVPSTWVAQCFSAQGVTVPLFVVPLGYNEQSFFPKCFASDQVTFGTAGNPSVSVASRKNIDMVIEAFSLAFKKESDVKLRVKVLPSCEVSSKGDPRIEVTREVMSEEAVGDWMRTLTAFVTASKGEAFGFFNVQAMACGVPVIACDFGGVTDYFSETVGYPVAYDLVAPRNEHYNTGLWAEPSLASLIDQMRRVYENREEAKDKGDAAIARVKGLTWEKSVSKLDIVLRKTGFWDSYKPVHTDGDEDKIRRFYRASIQMPKGVIPDLSRMALSNTPRGLGDTLLLTHLPKAGGAQGKPLFIHANPQEHLHFAPLMKFNPYYVQKPDDYGVVMADVLQKQADMGNGHFIQRLQRAFGLLPDLLPKPYIEYPVMKSANRVVMHFEAGGPHSSWQRVHLHPRARQLYPESRAIIQEFINRHRELEFIQIGVDQQPFENVQSVPCGTLEDMIKLIASSTWFLGIVSGPMHVASAFDLKSIVILNFPVASKIFLPTLQDIDQVESEWLLPQNVHLHQESEGPLVPRFGYGSLEAAFEGKVYPYWSNRFLGLINERL